LDTAVQETLERAWKVHDHDGFFGTGQVGDLQTNQRHLIAREMRGINLNAHHDGTRG
jgi:hypothetical protein